MTPQTAIDPVCGMTVDPARAAGSTDYKGTTYYFCAQSCLKRFTADPESFLNKPAGHHQPMVAPMTLRKRQPGAPAPAAVPTPAAPPAPSPAASPPGTMYICPMD